MCHSASKIENCNRQREKKKKKRKKIQKQLKKKLKHKENKHFLNHCCQNPFPLWESQSTLPPQEAHQHCTVLWICCGGSSDSNLVLLLCVLVSNVCLLLWELAMPFYIFHRHRVCLVDPVDLICQLYSWWEDFGSSPLATLPLGFNCGFIYTSVCVLSIGVQNWTWKNRLVPNRKRSMTRLYIVTLLI